MRDCFKKSTKFIDLGKNFCESNLKSIAKNGVVYSNLHLNARKRLAMRVIKFTIWTDIWDYCGSSPYL